MNFKAIAISILSLILLIGVVQVDDVYADSIRSIDSVNQDISSVEKDIIDRVEKVNFINNEINHIKSIIEENKKEILKKESEIKGFNQEVEDLKAEIKKLEEGIDARNEIIKNRLQAIQITGGQESYLDVLLGSTSFESFISRMSAVQVLMKADSDLMNEQVIAVDEVDESKDLISAKLLKSKENKADLIKIGEDNTVKEKDLAQTKFTVNAEKKSLEKKRSAYVKEGNDIKELEEKTRIAIANKKAEEARVLAAAKEKSIAIANSQLETKSAKTNNSTSSKSTPSKSAPSTSASAPGSAGKTMTMTATAYTADCYGCSGITKTGINLKNNRHLKVIAVDPRVIPLGSKVWVSGYGEAIAGDTGGAIKGNIIDLHFPTKSSALQFGRRTVTVKILK